MLLLWRNYYGDGTTYSNLDGPPELAPGVDLQVIVTTDSENGRCMISGGNAGRRDDYYWWNPEREEWWVGDLFGLYDYLQQPGWRKVIFGRSLGKEAFKKIWQRALTDPDFPPKTAWRPHERDRS